jgi:hypothetical protein
MRGNQSSHVECFKMDINDASLVWTLSNSLVLRLILGEKGGGILLGYAIHAWLKSHIYII